MPAAVPERGEDRLMKKLAIILAVMLFAAVAYGEDSPDRTHVKIVRVPAQCLETGSAEQGGVNYTCAKVDTAEVWNDTELRKFDKDIFEAYQQAAPRPPEPRTLVGLVVRQETLETTEHIQKSTTPRKEVALVERRDGYKYRYARR